MKLGRNSLYPLKVAYILALGSLFITSQTQAKPLSEDPPTCSKVNNIWEEKKLGPPPQQEDAQWCFAYASANLIALKLGHLVSAKHMALDFHRSQNRYDLNLYLMKNEGGYVKKTIDLAIARGTCSTISNEPLVATCPDCVVEKLNEKYLKCDRKVEKFGHPQNMPIRNEDNEQNPHTLDTIRLLMDEKMPFALGIDLEFMLKRGHMGHAVTVVGRKYNHEKERCEYIAVDSNTTYPDLKPGFEDRSKNSFLTLTDDEIVQYGISLDFLR